MTGGQLGLPHHDGLQGTATGTTSISGVSPLALDYQVSLAGIPHGAKVLSVETFYQVGGPAFDISVSDSGGSAVFTAGSYYILWDLDHRMAVQGGLGQNGSFGVHADAAFSGKFGTFNLYQFIVTWVLEA